MPKEKVVSYSLTIHPSLLNEVKESAKKYSEVNVSREIRRLLKKGLESEKVKSE